MSGFFMHRFFANFHLLDTVLVHQDQPIFHQISRVFRARKWDLVIFFEAHWCDCIYELVGIDKNNLKFVKKDEIAKTKETQNAPIFTLFQAYPNKISTLEILVQKIVEVWAQKIVLFSTERSQMQSISVNKITRISTIAQEAMEQSHGNSPLIIEQYDSIVETFEKYSWMRHILAHPEGNKGIAHWLPSEIGLWVWPEGGWSQKEEDFFKKQKFIFWSFNKNILRLETAAIVGLGILNHHYFETPL